MIYITQVTNNYDHTTLNIMSEGFLPPKKGYFLPKKSYVRNNDEEEDGEDSKSRKRKNEDAEDDGTNTKRSRVDDDEKKKIEEEDIFGGESSDFSSSDDDDDDYDDDDDDDDDDIDDKEGYGDGFGDDLMGDMDDRKRLYTMTEVEREAILEERRMKREAFMENKRLRRELAKAEAEKKKKKSKTRGRLKKVGRDDSDEDSDDVDDDDDFALSDDDDEGFVSDTGKESSTFQEVEEDVVPLTTEDVNRLRFTRKKIGRFLDEPYLEKIATGAFVRYCLGMNKKTNQRTYRMCTIRGLGKPYKRVYRLNGLQTDKTFVLEQGGTSRPCKLDMISDHRITQKELDFWLRQEDDLGNKVPTREELMKRYKNIVDTVEGHVYTDQEVNEMVRLRKERNKNKITNYGIEILQIQEELQLALEKRDGGGGEDQEDLDEKIENLKQRLKYLEEEEKERRSKRTDNVISNMHTINQKNIKYNTARAREIARKRLNEEKRTMGTVKKHDPFKRRETVVQNLWLSKPKKKERKKKEKETEDTKTSSKKEELDTVSEILGVSKVVSTDDIRSRRTKEHSRAIGTTTSSSSSTSSRNKSASSSASTKKKKQHKKKKKKKGMSLAEWKRRHQ